MKVTVHEKQERKYPYAGQFRTGTVVLFFAEKTGVVVAASSENYPLGAYAENWCEGGTIPVNVTIEV